MLASLGLAISKASSVAAGTPSPPLTACVRRACQLPIGACSFRRLPRRRPQPEPLEPSYLQPPRQPAPLLSLVDVRLRGHDFAVLEHFGGWVHRTLAAAMPGAAISDAWATPCCVTRVERLRAAGGGGGGRDEASSAASVVAAEYQLREYERTVQLRLLAAHQLGALLDVVTAAAPCGVRVQVRRHCETECAEARYIPDLQLLELQQEMDLLGTEHYDSRKRSVTVEFWLSIASRHRRVKKKDDAD